MNKNFRSKSLGTWADNQSAIKGFANLIVIRSFFAALISQASSQTTRPATANNQTSAPNNQGKILDFEIFPTGQWPKNFSNLNLPKKNSTRTFQIPARIYFLQNLKPDLVISGVGFGSKGQNRWLAFIFQDRAVVENPFYGNASYLFRVDPQDQWLDSLEHSRYEVWSRQAGCGFVKRLFHQLDWEDRILDFLTDPNN